MEFCALASGSKGNSIYVGAEGRGVLVDAGLPGREIERRLWAAELDPVGVEAVVVTHEHRDHIAGVGVWARRFGVPVYAARAAWDAARAFLPPPTLRGVDVRFFEPDRSFAAAGLELTPVSTSHDAADSVGFRISDGNAVLGFATDLGFASHLVREGLRGVTLLYLESNHDEDLLINGPYPWPLKQRIRSRHGHLSNADCAGLVSDLLHSGLKALVLGHLSETNNTPRLAYDCAREALARHGAAGDVALLVARQDRPGTVVRLGG
ncbi:MAG: MBL fold metallo-hydrolase [Deltaproteobacteria bacterium]|nr:MBL fold metallo-hydrolase [Deltaproteobacteria bacterium]